MAKTIDRPFKKQASDRMELVRTNSLVDLKVKLPPLEWQHFSSVLKEAIKKLEIIAILPYLLNQKEKFKNILGCELMEHLGRHKIILEALKELMVLNNRYNEEIDILQTKNEDFLNDLDTKITSHALVVDDQVSLFNPKVSSRNNRLQQQIEMVGKNRDLVAQKLKSSCRIILKYLHKNPLACKTIRNDKDLQISEEMDKFINQVNCLKLVLTKKVSITTEVKREKILEFNSFLEQKENNELMITQLKNDLSLIEKEMEDLLWIENEKVYKLRETLETMRAQQDECLDNIRSETKKQELTCQKNEESKTRKMKQELEQVKSKYDSALEMHFSEEAQLRKKKYKIEAELEDAIQNFDKEMLEREKEMEEINDLYQKEKRMLEITEQKFKALKVEYDRVMEERKANERKLQIEQLEVEKLTRAVTIIQSMWRSYKVNKVIRARRKKATGSNLVRRKSMLKKS